MPRLPFDMPWRFNPRDHGFPHRASPGGDWTLEVGIAFDGGYTWSVVNADGREMRGQTNEYAPACDAAEAAFAEMSGAAEGRTPNQQDKA